MRSFLINIFRSLTDLFFPPCCLLCSEYLDTEVYICDKCIRSLNIFKNDRPLFFSAFKYNSDMRKLIHELKYRERPEIGKILGKETGKKISRFLEPEVSAVTIPVPLHKKRLSKRGYNQSLEVAKGFYEASGIEFRKDLLKRNINNVSQTKLDSSSRSENVKGIFSLSGNCKLDKNDLIIIIDDVISTGSTVKEIFSVFNKAGYKNLFAVSIASRSLDP